MPEVVFKDDKVLFSKEGRVLFADRPTRNPCDCCGRPVIINCTSCEDITDWSANPCARLEVEYLTNYGTEDGGTTCLARITIVSTAGIVDPTSIIWSQGSAQPSGNPLQRIMQFNRCSPKCYCVTARFRITRPNGEVCQTRS